MGKKIQLLIADDDSATREMMEAFFRWMEKNLSAGLINSILPSL